MERGSDKHAAMLDEALKGDTAPLRRGEPNEARSQEAREQEGPAEGEPTPDTHLTGNAEVPGTEMTLDDINGRAELARYLEHGRFPGRPAELAAHARERHAPDGVVEQLLRAPDRLFENVSEVWAALGGRVENTRDGRQD